MYPYYNNQNMLNQLIRQKENVENMINQYSQVQNQPPIQNIINQGANNLEFEARYLKDGESVNNIGIMRKTLFIDEPNKKISIKELDGSISKEYEIVIPLDEKDKKILELEKEIESMKEVINNVKYAEPIRTNDELNEPVTDDVESVESKPKKLFKSVSKNEPK